MSGRYRERDEVRAQALRIMEALSGVDEELLERCQGMQEGEGRGGDLGARDIYDTSVISFKARRGRAKRRAGRFPAAWAAALCLALAGAMSWGGYRLILGDEPRMDRQMAGGPEAIELESGAENGFAGQNDESGDGKDLGGQNEEAGGGNGFAGQNDETAETSPDALEKGAGVSDSGQAVSDSMGSLSVSSSEKAEVEKEGAEEASQYGDKEANREDRQEGLSQEGCPALRSVKYTEAEARELEPVSTYLPTRLPAGYVFEEAYRNQDIPEENLTVSWSREWDSIILSVTVEEEAPATVDAGKPETYDQRLYSVPYGETVPEAYRETFDNPVFAAEDFTLEIVRSRMISYEDAGDTDTPRGCFSVLYPDNVLVRFNGRGTPEEIWEMFRGLGQDGR